MLEDTAMPDNVVPLPSSNPSLPNEVKQGSSDNVQLIFAGLLKTLDHLIETRTLEENAKAVNGLSVIDSKASIR